MNKKSQRNLGRVALLPHTQTILLATMGCPTFTLKTAPSHQWYLLPSNTPIPWLTPLTTWYGMQIQSAILWLSRLITPCDNFTATSTYTQPSIKLPVGNHKLPQIHPQNSPFPIDNHHKKPNMPIQNPILTTIPTTYRSTIRFARMMNVDWQTDYGALQCIAQCCEMLWNACGTFRCIAVHCRNFT